MTVRMAVGLRTMYGGLPTAPVQVLERQLLPPPHLQIRGLLIGVTSCAAGEWPDIHH